MYLHVLIIGAASFAKCFQNIKPHLTDSVLTVLIQNRLSDARVVNFGVTLVESTHLKVCLSYFELSYS